MDPHVRNTVQALQAWTAPTRRDVSVQKSKSPFFYSAVSSCLDGMEKTFCSCFTCSVCSGSNGESGGGEIPGPNASSVGSECVNEESSF